jgi:hypothetical protein
LGTMARVEGEGARGSRPRNGQADRAARRIRRCAAARSCRQLPAFVVPRKRRVSLRPTPSKAARRIQAAFKKIVRAKAGAAAIAAPSAAGAAAAAFAAGTLGRPPWDPAQQPPSAGAKPISSYRPVVLPPHAPFAHAGRPGPSARASTAALRYSDASVLMGSPRLTGSPSGNAAVAAAEGLTVRPSWGSGPHCSLAACCCLLLLSGPLLHLCS